MNEDKFIYKGKKIKSRVVHTFTCRKCIFEKRRECDTDDNIPACACMTRNDKENVIFVEDDNNKE